MKLRAWLANAALAAVGLVVALCLGELMVRLTPPLARKAAARQARLRPQVQIHPQGLYRMDTDTTWTLTPGFSGRLSRSYFDILVEANSKGLRDRDFPRKASGVFRILGLGDSFAFGWGVPLEATFFKDLEALLNASGPGVVHEVINGGLPGFGTYEALHVLTSVSPDYEPDLVLLAFYEGNDYVNNGEAPRRRAIVDGYLADLPSVERSRLTRFVLGHSALFALLDEQWSLVQQKRAFRASVEKTKRYLLEMKRALGERRVPLVLVFIPDQGAGAYHRTAFQRWSDRLLRGEDRFAQRAELESFCRANEIGFCRLSSRFEDDPGSGALRLAPQDAHFSVEGHRAAAEEIHSWLSSHPSALEGSAHAPTTPR